MSAIYKPKGRAKEYCDLALNLYSGCEYSCGFCYAPAATFKSRDEFAKAKPRKDIIEKLKKEAHKYKGQEVLLSFSCDTYQPIDDELRLTRQAIEILNGNSVMVNILTKAGAASMRDFDLLSQNKGNKYGATLTFTNHYMSTQYEPFAASPESRMHALSEAKKQGIQTWASLEPVIHPSQTLDAVIKTAGFVDEYKVGKWNYDKRANMIDWKRFLHDIVDLFEKENLNYYIKEDLRKYA